MLFVLESNYSESVDRNTSFEKMQYLMRKHLSG